MGLAFNEVKTQIVRLAEGFDFLGSHVRRYFNGKLIIKPSDRRLTPPAHPLRPLSRRGSPLMAGRSPALGAFACDWWPVTARFLQILKT
jgi:hypothetical protein